jgi:drug/metabolite transporter (DMT)-like permease
VRPAPETDNARGFIPVIAAGLLLTLESVLVRVVGEDASAPQIVFARATAQLVLVALWLTWKDEWHLIRTNHPFLHIARGLASLVCWAFYYVTFRRLNLATATTLTFTTQLFAVALAGPV